MFRRLNVHAGKCAKTDVGACAKRCFINTLPGCLHSAGSPKEQEGSPEYLHGEARAGCFGYWSHWEGSGGRRGHEAHTGPWGGAGGRNHHQTCNIPDSPPLKWTFVNPDCSPGKKSRQHSMKRRIKQTDLNVATWSWQLETSCQQ